MRGAIPHSPSTPSWRGAQLESTWTTLPLPLFVSPCWTHACDNVASCISFAFHYPNNTR